MSCALYTKPIAIRTTEPSYSIMSAGMNLTRKKFPNFLMPKCSPIIAFVNEKPAQHLFTTFFQSLRITTLPTCAIVSILGVPNRKLSSISSRSFKYSAGTSNLKGPPIDLMLQMSVDFDSPEQSRATPRVSASRCLFRSRSTDVVPPKTIPVLLKKSLASIVHAITDAGAVLPTLLSIIMLASFFCLRKAIRLARLTRGTSAPVSVRPARGTSPSSMRK